jgi:uroporphyrinogen-III synthase
VGEAGRSSLHGKRVVITRAKEQSGDLFQRLLALDAVPICAPLIRFAPADESGPLDVALRNLDDFDWLFLTSQNALRFVLERARVLGISLTQQATAIRVAAVAPVTAAAAEKAGLAVSYVSMKHQGIGLAEELGPQLQGRRVLLPRSDKADRELPEALRKVGAEVVDLIAYHTLETQTEENKLPDIVRQGEMDAIVFYSPSAVHRFLDILRSEQTEMAKRKTLFVAIGPVTAAALRESGVKRIAQAADTATGAVLEALSGAFGSAAPKTSAGAKIE